MKNRINYQIPPLTPAEAFEYIKEHRYHVDAYCYEGYDSSCSCLQVLFDILDGHPFLHDQPCIPPKKWEDMTPEEQREFKHQQLMLKLMSAMVLNDTRKSSVFSDMLYPKSGEEKSQTITYRGGD